MYFCRVESHLFPSFKLSCLKDAKIILQEEVGLHPRTIWTISRHRQQPQHQLMGLTDIYPVSQYITCSQSVLGYLDWFIRVRPISALWLHKPRLVGGFLLSSRVHYCLSLSRYIQLRQNRRRLQRTSSKYIFSLKEKTDRHQNQRQLCHKQFNVYSTE